MLDPGDQIDPAQAALLRAGAVDLEATGSGRDSTAAASKRP